MARSSDRDDDDDVRISHRRARHDEREDRRGTRALEEGSDASRHIRRRRRSESPGRLRHHTDRHRHRSRDRHSSHRRRRERRDDSDSDSDAARRSRKAPSRRGPLPSQESSFAVSAGLEPDKPKEKPNFGNSGALATAANSLALADGSSLVLKYSEPPEARKAPARDQWKLFVFKGSSIVDTIDLSPRSCWLIGRETAIVDMAAEHPSISKQHAVIQFRYTEKRNEFGDRIGKVKPYLMDLDSANGSTLNHDKAPGNQYLELRDKDMIQFGQSTREYVLMLAPRD